MSFISPSQMFDKTSNKYPDTCKKKKTPKNIYFIVALIVLGGTKEHL